MTPLVGIIMGSTSDWETMQEAARLLDELGVPHEVRVVSAHRTPDDMFAYAASAADRGLEVIIAGAGGAAHLPGMTAAKTLLPVIGVPVESRVLRGVDSLLSIVQMPAGVPVATVAIGRAGAANAALLAAAILANKHTPVRDRLRQFRERQSAAVQRQPDPRTSTESPALGERSDASTSHAARSSRQSASDSPQSSRPGADTTKSKLQHPKSSEEGPLPP